MVFAVVSVALIWKRLYNRELPLKEQLMPFSLLMLMLLASIGEHQQPELYTGCYTLPQSRLLAAS